MQLAALDKAYAMTTEQTRVSVGLTREEYEQVHKLARRCNTSASALGQLGYRHLLLRTKNGTIPMLPIEPAAVQDSPLDLIRARSSAGVAFWRDEDGMADRDEPVPGLFPDTDLGRPTTILCPLPKKPVPPEQLRISVGLTRDELDQVQSLAGRCNTSASALGQLAYRHLLLQAESGAIPMLPPPIWATDLYRAREHSDWLEATVNYNKSIEELNRLVNLTSGES